MTTSDKLREFGQKVMREYGRWWGIEEKDTDKFLSDLTALISEKQAEYFEFVKWIGFYLTTLYYRDIDEKWLRTRFDIDGIPTEEYDEYTTEELFEYWKTNEQ